MVSTKQPLQGAASFEKAGGDGFDLEAVLQKIIVENNKGVKNEVDPSKQGQYSQYNPAGGLWMEIPDTELVQGPKAMPIPPQLTPQQQYQLGRMVNSINGKVKSDVIMHKQPVGDYIQALKKQQDRNKAATTISQADEFLGKDRAYYADDKIAVTY